jgi:hypothetical protein
MAENQDIKEEPVEQLLSEMDEQERMEFARELESIEPDKAFENLLRKMEQRESPEDELFSQKGEPSASEPEESTVESSTDQSSEPLLTEEERQFFFQPQEESVDVEAVESDPELYENWVDSPGVKDIKLLIYLLLGAVSVLIFLNVFSSYLQYSNQKLLMQNQKTLQAGELGNSEDYEEAFYKFLELPRELRKVKLRAKLESSLATQSEKRTCLFLLAVMAFEEGDYSHGREFMTEGVKLANEE